MTTLTAEQREMLATWSANLAPAWYQTHPDTEYVRGVGALPDSRDLALGVVLPLLGALRVRAIYREHDEALIALRPDKEAGGVLAVYPRAQLVEMLRTVVAALPPAENREFSEALSTLRRTLPERYLDEAVAYALDRRASLDPISDDDAVRLTPRPAAGRRTSAAQRDEHVRLFLRSVPCGEHPTARVFAEYERAARRSGIRPLGRTTFFGIADLELGPRVRSSKGAAYRVTPPALDPTDFSAADVLGFRPAPPIGAARATLLRALARARD